ncbi:MAG: lipopolysaccharide heptosyltransferase I [Thermoanaerobaculia bacterium]
MNRLLVIRLSAFGDVIHTIPAVVALRRALPSTEIAWAVEPIYQELVEIVAAVKVIPAPLKRWGKNLLSSRREIRAVTRQLREFAAGQTAIDFQGLAKSALVARVSGARERFGLHPESARERISTWLTNRHVRIEPREHVIDWNLRLAREVAPDLEPSPLVDFSPFASDPLGKLAQFERRIILLPAAGRPQKQWPAERFRELARRLGHRTLVAWGPGEQDLASQLGAEMAPPTTLRELAHLLRNASLVIGGDTGPLHLAAALGTPVVGLYGPTDPRRNGPYGQLERVVESSPSPRSMESISVDDVIRFIENPI